jgi:hypothetical protein
MQLERFRVRLTTFCSLAAFSARITTPMPLITCTPTVTIQEYPDAGCELPCHSGWNACIMDSKRNLQPRAHFLLRP